MTQDLLATYPSAEAARRAVTALERQGVEAADIELRGQAAVDASVPTDGDAMHNADSATTSKIGRRALSGGITGAVVGAVLGGLLGGLVVGGVGPALGGALAFAALAFGLGFFWGGASGLPVSEAWGDTFAAGEGETMVVVHLHDEAADRRDMLAEALRDAGARRLDVA
jgi:hypothetical protein